MSGGISLIDNAQSYVGGHPEGLDVISFLIPRATLDQALGPSRHAVGSSITAAQTSFPIVAGYLQSLVEHGALLDPARQARMASVAVELLATSFAERLEADPLRSLSGAAILTRAQAFITQHIGVEGLSINDVAAALNISVRRLQEVASAENVALMDWMWDVLYWSWGVLVLVVAVGDRGWWAMGVVPLYSAWLAWSTYAGVRRGFGGLGGEEGSEGSGAKSKRSVKMEKRGQRVQYR